MSKSASAGGSRFPTTHWTVVLRAVAPGTDDFRRAFGVFWERYHGPLRAFLRSQGHTVDANEELLQGFLAGIVSGSLRGADPSEGRFRNYLLRSLTNYVASDMRAKRRQKRGADAPHVSLEAQHDAEEVRFIAEPATTDDPARVFEREWAIRVMDLALGQLEERYRNKDDHETFEALVGHLAHDRDGEPFEQVAERLGRRPQTVRVQASRLRDHFREELCKVVSETVGNDEEIDSEIDFLFAALEREPGLM